MPTMPTPPTKAQELAILDATIAQLGPFSYLGPWLTQVRAELEGHLRADHFPQITLAYAAQQTASIHADAVREAEILARRQREAIEASDRAILAAKVEAGRALHLVSQEVQRLATRVAAKF